MQKILLLKFVLVGKQYNSMLLLLNRYLQDISSNLITLQWQQPVLVHTEDRFLVPYSDSRFLLDSWYTLTRLLKSICQVSIEYTRSPLYYWRISLRDNQYRLFLQLKRRFRLDIVGSQKEKRIRPQSHFLRDSLSKHLRKSLQ